MNVLTWVFVRKEVILSQQTGYWTCDAGETE